MATKKSKSQSDNKEDEITQIYEKLSSNEELIAQYDKITSLSEKRDLETFKIDKEEYKLNKESFEKRAKELVKLDKFWKNVFEKTFSNLFTDTDDGLLSHITDFFVEETDSEFKITFTFSKNKFVKDDKYTIVCRTPVTLEDLKEEMPVTVVPEVQLKVKHSEDPFINFLLDPTGQVCTMIVGEVWKNPLYVYQTEIGTMIEGEDFEDGEDDEDDEEGDE